MNSVNSVLEVNAIKRALLKMSEENGDPELFDSVMAETQREMIKMIDENKTKSKRGE